jgi:deazaflavin-dependent oxidoreductase (nitroreductase family)
MSTVEPPDDPHLVAKPWSRFADEQYCYLVTTDQGTLYMLSGAGDRSDWVKNLRRDPEVRVEIGTCSFQGRARIVKDPTESQRARALVYDKYAPGYRGDLTSWRRRSLPIAVDFERPAEDR